MKLIAGILISEVENGEYVVVAMGKAAQKFNGMIRMNGTAAFIARQLQTAKSEKQLVAALREEYDVSEEEALENVRSVTEKLRAEGILRD